jgi:hypothetical protein
MNVVLRAVGLSFLAWIAVHDANFASAADAAGKIGVPITYELPTTGELPQTYRVTLAIVDAKNPDWLISQFAAGIVRTVTKENQGKFTELWNGLDDNFMPVPPGDYGVKGIYMPAKKWAPDGEFHSVTPRFFTEASAWRAKPGENKPPVITGDPVNSPIGDVDVGADGMGVFCYVYLENSRNYYMADFNRPIDYEQVTASYNSGGAAGGRTIATDGITAWCRENEGFIFRTDGKKFGDADATYRRGVYQPEGFVTSMAAFRNAAAEKSFVYIGMRGKLDREGKEYSPDESKTEFVNKLVVLDGDSAETLAEHKINQPAAVVARWGDKLWVLHKDTQDGDVVSSAELKSGLPTGEFKPELNLPGNIAPNDLEVDSHDRLYLADAKANKVYQFNAQGKLTHTFGRLAVQEPGTYDEDTFMSPGKLSCYRNEAGHDRLIVVETAGVDRVSEWDPETGKLLRTWLSAQTYANAGYAVDPKQPDRIYMQGHGGWLTQFKIDNETGAWNVAAVWPNVCTGRFEHHHNGFPRLFYRGETRYLAFSRGHFIYREAGNRWLASAAILTVGEGNQRQRYLWSDANGDGEVQDEEYKPHPTVSPPGTMSYWGDTWLEDLSLMAIQIGGDSIWRLAPASFDAHGNPVYAQDGWQPVLTDPIFTSRRAGTATATHGGNEIANDYSSDWAKAVGSIESGFYVNGRGGPNLSANFGAQQKLSRYVPDGKGGFRQVWRAGRTAIQGNAQPGEIYGAINVTPPIGGLVTLVDQSRMGMLLYTEEGLYVDTLFPDDRQITRETAGPYLQPGEFFTGYSYLNPANDKIYFALGKATPMIFEAEGWTGSSNPTRPLTTVQKQVTIKATQIASPPEVALSFRGGAGEAKVARFTPALGDVAFDGSLSGWESSEPIVFQPDKQQSVEVRCLYRPDELLLRWHARLASKFQLKPMPALERMFTHDQLADTLSFYLQGDVDSQPDGSAAGRPGDARFVFGVFAERDTAKPVILGMYPTWTGKAKPTPQTYRSPVGEAAFAHVGPVADAKLFHKLDDDGQGFVLVASIPRSAIPQIKQPFGDHFRTLVNFDATFAGHNRFWWANRDGSATRETYDEPTEARLYPGSWSTAQFQGLEQGVVVRHWLTCGPFGGPGTEKFKYDPNGDVAGTKIEMKRAVREFCEAAKYPPDDLKVDLEAKYTGPMIQGYWNGPREVRWQPATIEDLDTRAKLGGGGQVWYGVTWIHVPAEMELEFQFQSHPQTYLRWVLNGENISPDDKAYAELENSLHRIAKKTVSLHSGWNQVNYRGYCTGYAPFRVGLVVQAPAEKLWQLKLSAEKPD